MGSGKHSRWRAFHQTCASVRTGIVLLILVGVAAAAGTLILQRPLTDPEQLQRAYSAETLRWLDAAGLTDVFHTWWFAVLLALLCINIVLASIERLPTAWRFFAHPYRRPDAHFRAGLALQKELAIRDAPTGLAAAEKAFREMGFRPARVAGDEGESLFVERNRFSRLAAYVVHASLLLIIGGAIADGLWGYRGYVTLTAGMQTNQIELRDATRRTLPFTLRCEGAGQENYPDGSPRRWWTKLTVLENGRETLRKEVAVNDPLTYGGLRFFQSGYGSTGELGVLRLRATSRKAPGAAREIALRPNEILPLDDATSLRLVAFVPDFILNGNQIESRSDQPNNPAIQLAVDSKEGKTATVWLFPRFPTYAQPAESPYTFEVRDLEMGYFSGLQVSHEPGQWAVWTGVVLMGLGMSLAFYFVHVRFWAVPIQDARGRWVLWLGAAASKNREEFAQRFARLAETVREEIRKQPAGYAEGKNGMLVNA